MGHKTEKNECARLLAGGRPVGGGPALAGGDHLAADAAATREAPVVPDAGVLRVGRAVALPALGLAVDLEPRLIEGQLDDGLDRVEVEAGGRHVRGGQAAVEQHLTLDVVVPLLRSRDDPLLDQVLELGRHDLALGVLLLEPDHADQVLELEAKLLVDEDLHMSGPGLDDDDVAPLVAGELHEGRVVADPGDHLELAALGSVDALDRGELEGRLADGVEPIALVVQGVEGDSCPRVDVLGLGRVVPVDQIDHGGQLRRGGLGVVGRDELEHVLHRRVRVHAQVRGEQARGALTVLALGAVDGVLVEGAPSDADQEDALRQPLLERLLLDVGAVHDGEPCRGDTREELLPKLLQQVATVVLLHVREGVREDLVDGARGLDRALSHVCSPCSQRAAFV